jgi:methylenetetrahydrofolate--tRNA-(uracil-5-)-methyltransferase
MTRGLAMVVPPPETALGSLIAYITDPGREGFQPMNANFGLMPELAIRARGRARKLAFGERALGAMTRWIAEQGAVPGAGAAPLAALAGR